MSMSWAAAARLARRTGFGATGDQVDAVQKLGQAAFVHHILATTPGTDPGAQATPVPAFDPLPAPGPNASRSQHAAYNRAMTAQMSTLTIWWLRRMAATQAPFDEKLTFVWHNHFATSAQKVVNAPQMLAQNQKLRTLGRESFGTLAYAMLTDTAMLRWLDGERNTAQAPNENLAREFMELMTLGHNDGYTETDVREGARALTGWTVGPSGVATFVPRRHDQGTKTVLGVTADLDAQGYCEVVLDRPASPGFVAGRTWGQLVSPTPPPAETLAAMTQAYGPRRNLSAMLTAMLMAPEFTTSAGQLVVTPLEWTIGAVRALQVPLADDRNVRTVTSTLRALGQLPFYPPNVSGWPSGQAWLSTAAADQRIQTADLLVAAGDVSAVEQAAPAARLDAVGHLLAVATWSDRSAAALRPLVMDARRLVAAALNTPEYLTN